MEMWEEQWQEEVIRGNSIFAGLRKMPRQRILATID